MKINIKCDNFFFLNIFKKILLNSLNRINTIKKRIIESIKYFWPILEFHDPAGALIFFGKISRRFLGSFIRSFVHSSFHIACHYSISASLSVNVTNDNDVML